MNTNSTHYIDVGKRACSCIKFSKLSMCHHLVAACLIAKVDLRGMPNRTMNSRARRGRNPEAADAIPDNADIEKYLSELTVSPNAKKTAPKNNAVPSHAEASVANIQAEAPPLLARRRPGRPRKMGPALSLE